MTTMVYFIYSGGHFTDAGKWCGLAMKIMPYLTTLKSNYDEKVRNISHKITYRNEHVMNNIA